MYRGVSKIEEQEIENDNQTQQNLQTYIVPQNYVQCDKAVVNIFPFPISCFPVLICTDPNAWAPGWLSITDRLVYKEESDIGKLEIRNGKFPNLCWSHMRMCSRSPTLCVDLARRRVARAIANSRFF